MECPSFIRCNRSVRASCLLCMATSCHPPDRRQKALQAEHISQASCDASLSLRVSLRHFGMGRSELTLNRLSKLSLYQSAVHPSPVPTAHTEVVPLVAQLFADSAAPPSREPRNTGARWPLSYSP